MGKHIGIDFGRNVTVIAASQVSCGPATLARLPGLSRDFPVPGCAPVPVIPSVIHYNPDGSFSIGEEAASPVFTGSRTTFRQLVYYLCENSPVLVSAGPGRKIGYREAGACFLTELMKRAAGMDDMTSQQVTVTRPFNAPSRYDEWVTGVAESAGVGAVSTIDIGCAVVLGYGLPFDDRDLYVIIDANPDSLEVAVIIPEHETGVDSGPCSRVLGRASAEFGGLCADSWIVAEILTTRGGFLSDDRREQVSGTLRHRCRMAREALSAADEMLVQIGDLLAGRGESVDFTRADLAGIFRKHGLFTLLDRTIARAFSAARVYGYDHDDITAVLMIGELSPFPPLQEAVRARFSPTIVRSDHALDAAALGMVKTGACQTNPVRADYAVRYWDPESREHRYRLLVRRGARCPGAGQVARIVISAAYDGQTRLGIPLCRISGDEQGALGPGLELVGSPGGGLRLAGPVTDCCVGSRPVVVNRTDPTYLSASPPARKGVPRFELTFTVDGQGYLCLTARDLVTGFLVKSAERIYRLT